ncbi:MAG: hypothetical protein ABJO86_00600 [Lentilitoribacter sp.]
MISLLPGSIIKNAKLIAVTVGAVAVTFMLTSIYDAVFDDPAVRREHAKEIKAQELADANARLTEMLENNHDFSQMSECDRFNELAGPSGLPLINCDR